VRILTVAPGPRFSTWDLWKYYTQAFIDLGHDVFTFKYHDHIAYNTSALKSVCGLDIYSEKNQKNSLMLSSEALISKIARTRPDVVFVVSALALPMNAWDWMNSFKESLKHPFKTMTLFTESPYVDYLQLEILRANDCAAVMDKASLESHREINKNTIYVPHAYSPEVHYPRPYSIDHVSDVFFVGTLFPERIELLSGVDWEGIDFRLFAGYSKGVEKSPINKYTIQSFLDNDTEVPKYYTNAGVSLNVFRTARVPAVDDEDVEHIGTDEAYSISPRCFEILACGGLLLTDARPELYDLFNVGKDLLVYDNASDLGDKIRYYLKYREERDAIVESGMQAVREYTYVKRASEIVSFLESMM